MSSLAELPRLTLGVLPTPVQQLSNLSKALGGPQILIKRDDLTGLALGGNKTRKLEYILADALQKGCDTVITAGAAQSNHCRQTAAAAAQLGLECHLVLGGEAPEQSTGNLLLNQLFAATIHWAGNNRKGEDIPTLAETLRQQGKKVYLVPYGGSNELGACGFVQAMHELEQQMDTSKLSHIVFASSSGGTHAGMLLGKAMLSARYQVQGINIDKSSGDVPFQQQVLKLLNSTADVLDIQAQFTVSDVVLADDYLASGYGVVGDAEREAINLLARYEGILLDPVYTGRAMAGLIDMIRCGQWHKGQQVLFWHTGGAPALFAYHQQLSVN